MNGLAEEGFALLAGPLSGSERGRIRVLLIVDAFDEQEIQRRLADDPWTRSDLLEITSIEPWRLFVGAERLPGPSRPRQTREMGLAALGHVSD